MNTYSYMDIIEETSILINNRNEINYRKNKKSIFNELFFNCKSHSLKCFMISLCIVLFLNREKVIYIELDNDLPLYEENIDFSNYSTNIKAIAFFIPHFYLDTEYKSNFTKWSEIKNNKPLYYSHNQPRVPLDEKKYLGYYNLTNPKILKIQAKLAKNHGIYGFGIYYYWFSGVKYYNKPLDIFFDNKDIDINFLLIWINENSFINLIDENIDDKEEYKEEDPINFIKDIKKYLFDNRYIKIQDKYVIGIYEPFNIINLNEVIGTWREKAREFGIGELFLLVSLKDCKIENIKNVNLFDATFQFPPSNIIRNNNKITQTPFYLYSAILYNDDIDNKISNFTEYKTLILQYDNSPKIKTNYTIFKEYSPELFYMLNRKIIKWTQNTYDENNRFIFINGWNNWGEGTYLEPDKEYGFASLNALSRALFNLSYCEKEYINFKNKCIIAVQAHIFYDDLIFEVINE